MTYSNDYDDVDDEGGLSPYYRRPLHQLRGDVLPQVQVKIDSALAAWNFALPVGPTNGR